MIQHNNVNSTYSDSNIKRVLYDVIYNILSKHLDTLDVFVSSVFGSTDFEYKRIVILLSASSLDLKSFHDLSKYFGIKTKFMNGILEIIYEFNIPYDPDSKEINSKTRFLLNMIDYIKSLTI